VALAFERLGLVLGRLRAVLLKEMHHAACGPVEALVRLFGEGLGGKHAAGLVLAQGHPERRLPAAQALELVLLGHAAAEPARQAEMVGVHVGADHPQDGPMLKVLVPNLTPELAHLGRGHPGVDHRPALLAVQFILDQPEVDVIQRKGQGHPKPENLVCDGGEAAPWGDGQVGIEDLRFKRVHPSIVQSQIDGRCRV